MKYIKHVQTHVLSPFYHNIHKKSRPLNFSNSVVSKKCPNHGFNPLNSEGSTQKNYFFVASNQIQYSSNFVGTLD